MQILSFLSPNCHYCQRQKSCKAQLTKAQNQVLLRKFATIDIPETFGIEIKCMAFEPNPDAFKVLIKSNGEIECLGLNKE